VPAYGWGLVLLGAYVLLVIMARWIYIARSNIVWTDAQAGAATRRLSMLDGRRRPGNGQAPVTPVSLQPLLDDIAKNTSACQRGDLVGWNGSRQIALWVTMHEAERLALPALSHEQLIARMERARGQLAELPQPRREAWEYVICTLLARKDERDRKRLDDDYRAYLDELLGEIYEASNGNAIQLSGLYNRATWIILVSLLPLAVLAGFGFGMLLVAGAIGGLVSRMQRLVFSTRIPVTYGSSWGPLFCAPVLGALAAWAGLVLISLLQTAGVLKLTALHTSLADLRAPTAAVLGIAILLGISERFLLRLEKQAESVIDPDHTGPTDQAVRTTAASQRVPVLRPDTPSGAVAASTAPASTAPASTAPASTAAANGDAATSGDAAKQDDHVPEEDSARLAPGLTGS
jgi:hypothetical protein